MLVNSVMLLKVIAIIKKMALSCLFLSIDLINLVPPGGADRSGSGGVKKGRGVSPNAAASVAATATAASASSSSSSGTDRI